MSLERNSTYTHIAIGEIHIRYWGIAFEKMEYFIPLAIDNATAVRTQTVFCLFDNGKIAWFPRGLISSSKAMSLVR